MESAQFMQVVPTPTYQEVNQGRSILKTSLSTTEVEVEIERIDDARTLIISQYTKNGGSSSKVTVDLPNSGDTSKVLELLQAAIGRMSSTTKYGYRGYPDIIGVNNTGRMNVKETRQTCDGK